ncbi:MAG TPA: hypothetical protein VFR27_02920 [Mycobacterium sp.]|nr:hypothetical protein [Mycobacterium sp.]
MRLTKLAATTALVVAGCWAAAGIAGAEPSPPTPAPTAPTAPPAPKTVIDADGSYIVGTDIMPGTYRSAGPVEKSVCYWKRVRGDQLIDNSLSKKPQLVQIEPTDTLFKTDHCQPWQKTECPPECVTTPPPPPGFPGNLKDFLPGLPPAPAPPAQAPPAGG